MRFGGGGGHDDKILTDPGKLGEKECVSVRALKVTLVAVISTLT